MTRPALILPVILADPSLPQVDYADLTGVPEFENASEHWLFQEGDASNLIGKLNGAVLTQNCPVSGVRSIALSNGGSGYSTAPAVAITGGGGSGATATAIVSGGAVIYVVVTAPGAGYTSDPTVGFSGGGGTGAVAAATRDGTPAYGASSLTTKSGGRNGLLTPFDDAADLTTCCVFKHATVSAPYAGSLLQGSLSTTQGGSMYVASGGNISGFTRPDTPQVVTGTSGALVNGSWYFAGLSWDSGAGKARYYIGGLGSLERTVAKTVAAAKTGLGNTNYGTSLFDMGAEFAEQIVFEDTPMSMAQMGEVYARSKVRMARRGITLV